MLPVERVIAVQGQEDAPILTEAYTGPGHLVNSRFLNGTDVESAKQVVINRAEAEGWGQGTTIRRPRGWGGCRPRYWGTLIPIIHCMGLGPDSFPLTHLT